MSHPHPNFNPSLPHPQYSNQNNYAKPQQYDQYQLVPHYVLPITVYGWGMPPPIVAPQHIQNLPKMVGENIAQTDIKVMQVLNTSAASISPEVDPEAMDNINNKAKQERTKPNVIPTTKFINETFDFNRKKRTRRKSKAEKLPDPQLTETVKEVLKQYELNQKSLASDVGCSETMVSQWINGTAKATGWSDFEVKIRDWLNQEHKKPEKGPAFDFIDESTRLTTKFLRKSKK